MSTDYTVNGVIIYVQNVHVIMYLLNNLVDIFIK